MAYVYILQSERNGKYYIGSTLDVYKRLRQHNAGKHHTSQRLGPFKLVFHQGYPDIRMARRIEHKIKRLRRRDYVEKIIREGRIHAGP